MTTTLSISDSQPPLTEADAIVIGVLPGPDGPVPAPGSARIDEAMGGSLAATLAALGATMATDEIDFAEQHSPSLSSGSELPDPDVS